MKLRAYCIYDNKALQYHAPFYAVTHGAAVRSFQDLVNDSSSSVSRHPSDYQLFFTGEFDDNSGAFDPHWPLEHVADAVSLVSQLKELV